MYPHGIMFHHFHDAGKHIRCQGSIDADDLAEMIEYYGINHNVISADCFFEKVRGKKLAENDVCITFDDALLCQYEIALPVLEAYNLKAFWFLYTSPLEGKYEKLEVYHHFRFLKFNSIDEYYEAFFSFITIFAYDQYGINMKDELLDFNPLEYKKESVFYTYNDRKFRYIRDEILKDEKYNTAMDFMLKEHGYEPSQYANDLWINEPMIKNLDSGGHIVGLHSHTHPTTMSLLNYDEQLSEYYKCQNTIENIIGKPVTAISYPCNSYNEDTLSIMNRLGIEIGFTAFINDSHGNLFLPREDHANIYKEMRLPK